MVNKEYVPNYKNNNSYQQEEFPNSFNHQQNKNPVKSSKEQYTKEPYTDEEDNSSRRVKETFKIPLTPTDWPWLYQAFIW